MLHRRTRAHMPVHGGVVHSSAKLRILLHALAHGRILQQGSYEQRQRSHRLVSVLVRHCRVARSRQYGVTGVPCRRLLSVTGVRNCRLLSVPSVGWLLLRRVAGMGCHRRRGGMSGVRGAGSRLMSRVGCRRPLSSGVTGMASGRLLSVVCVRGSTGRSRRMARMRVGAPGRFGMTCMGVVRCSRIAAGGVRGVRISFRGVRSVRVRSGGIPHLGRILRGLRPGGWSAVLDMICPVGSARNQEGCNGGEADTCFRLHGEPPSVAVRRLLRGGVSFVNTAMHLPDHAQVLLHGRA